MRRAEQHLVRSFFYGGFKDNLSCVEQQSVEVMAYTSERRKRIFFVCLFRARFCFSPRVFLSVLNHRAPAGMT